MNNPPSSESTLKGSSGEDESSDMSVVFHWRSRGFLLWGGGLNRTSGMLVPLSEVAECGETIRTVFFDVLRISTYHRHFVFAFRSLRAQ